MVEVLKGLHSMDHSEAGNHQMESWILDCDDCLILIDGGMRQKALDNIEAELREMSKEWADVSLILITHKHGDHIQNLARLVELTGAPVKAHELEAPLIKEAVGVYVEGLEDKAVLGYCGGIEVIHVPGHSEGNACYYLPALKAVIAGDTIFGDDEGNINPPPERYCLDVDQATKEIKRLLDYEFDHILFTHGKDIMGDAKAKVQELVDRFC
ncbi:MAG: MBL fold metallo-hydrolase [Candidatus Bathyarchaeota archaeon]|nr:MBL fold metallo-hydrolase [Candidatus Bathyarchaeota archaeon]